MPQAKLPDLNAAFVKYRSFGLQCVEIQNFSGAIGALYGINALLPDEYRIEIDSDKYKSLISERIIVVCSDCESEFNYADIKQKKELLPSFQASILGRDYEKTWFCNKCKKTNIISKTKMIKSSLNKPYYLKVVEEPPDKHDGVENMMNYKKRMKKWFYGFLGELEYQLGLYRKEYTSETEDENEKVEDTGETEFD